MTIEVVCECGWRIESNDAAAVSVACKTHDDTCPAMFKPDNVTIGDFGPPPTRPT